MKFPVGKSYSDFLAYWYNAQAFEYKTDYGYHEGDDFNLRTGGDSDLGQPVYACAAGTVTSVHKHNTIPTFGTHVHIHHPTLGVWSHYAHLNSVSVSEGQEVEEGQQIGTLGKSGTKYAHLHFAIKNQPTGIDAVCKTKADLGKWENPTAFIKQRLDLPPMPNTIAVDSKIFEDLVKKATERDDIGKAGVNSAADVESLKSSVKQAQDERNTAMDEAKKTREEFVTFTQQVAEKLSSAQDLPRILSALDDIIKKVDFLEDKTAKDSQENEQYEQKIIELKTEITRLTLLLKSADPLSQTTITELFHELLRRLTQIIGRK